jgi:xanthine dehydrogenase YagR molybdenum-binding subunit
LLALARLAPGTAFARARLEDVVFRDGALALRDDPASTVPLTTLLAGAGRASVEASYLLLPNLLEQR